MSGKVYKLIRAGDYGRVLVKRSATTQSMENRYERLILRCKIREKRYFIK